MSFGVALVLGLVCVVLAWQLLRTYRVVHDLRQRLVDLQPPGSVTRSERPGRDAQVNAISGDHLSSESSPSDSTSDAISNVSGTDEESCGICGGSPCHCGRSSDPWDTTSEWGRSKAAARWWSR